MFFTVDLLKLYVDSETAKDDTGTQLVIWLIMGSLSLSLSTLSLPPQALPEMGSLT